MNKTILFLGLHLFIFNITTAQLCFSPPNNYVVALNPFSVTSADFNGDGKMDLATTSLISGGLGTVSVILGNGTGGFSAATNFTVGSSPYFIISEDFNGDGNMDLACANMGSNNVSVLLGNGKGGFALATNFTVGSLPHSIISADFNGDGIKDIATPNRDSKNISILLGNGTGGFSTATNYTVGSHPTKITSADFNGDGKMDLVTAGNNTNISVLLGNGSGGFSASTNITTRFSACSITSADFNGDGKMDLATGSGFVFLGNGLGGFSPTTDFGSNSCNSIVKSYDFNGDGKIDIATTGGPNGDKIVVYRGNGVGGFSAPDIFPVGKTTIYDITSADFNGDGKMDLATANSVDGGASVLLGLITISISQTDVTCKGGNNGSATVTATCGTSLTYSWNTTPIQTTPTATGLSAGTYTVTVTEGIAKKTETIIITESPISITIVQTDVFCTKGSNGTAAATVTGGIGPYSYSWSTLPVQTTATANNLSAGIYTLTVTDSNSCIKTKSITITELPAISVSTTKTDASCSGGTSDGTATAVPSGGTPPYFYSWNTTPMQNTSKAINLAVGNYIVTVTDTKGCVKTQNVSIGSLPPIAISIVKTDSSCPFFDGIGYSFGNGSATANVTGGTPPYTYSWNTPNKYTFGTITGLGAGTYIVTVKDAKNCTNTANVTISSPQPIKATEVHTDVTCYGLNNGTATINVTGGIPPYKYLWNTLNNETTQMVENLPSGTFSPIITDSKGCRSFPGVSISILEPDILSAEITQTPNNKCSGTCDGYIYMIPSGGTSPYTYKWDALANNQTTQTATGLCSGNYTVTITDSKGCVVNKEVVVTNSSDSGFNEEVYLTNIAAVDQVNVSPAFASYHTYNLPAKITPNPTNLRNFVDPGKKARFKVECTNKKANGKSIVSGVCQVRSNCPYITITDASSALNNIGWNNKAWSADEFEIEIKPNTPPGTIAYIDFIVIENGVEYPTTCIPLPITPLNYSPTTSATIDDDDNPDSKGNDNEVCEPNEIIEFYPWLDNVSALSAEFVRGRFENLDNLSYINIWNNKSGVNTTVFDSTWWNFSFAQPAIINSYSTDMTPEFDFVFDYNNSNIVNNFKLHMVMAGGFKLFPGNALSLVQWSLPYVFNSSSLAVEEFLNDNNLMIYPNPTNSFLNIKSNNDTVVEKIVITDLTGKKILEQTQNTNQINVQNLANGIYMLEATINDITITRKFIKQ